MEQKIEFVLPEQFEARMKYLLKDEWNDFLESYESNRFQALRINTQKAGLEEKRECILNLFHLTNKVTWAQNSYFYDGDVRPGKHPYHEIGAYYIQEPSAMSAAAVLAPEPGMRVLDLCAAPGGKSTQLASLLQGQGILVANEINSLRCKILSQNVERMGIANAIVTNEDSERLARHFGCFFHAILVDAPCSGEGMFRKNPEAMEEWSEENVQLCAKRQNEILDNAAQMLLPGGKMVYSTCTFSPEENEQTIATFLSEHPEFKLLPIEQNLFSDAKPEWGVKENIANDICESLKNAKRLWPHKINGEGHYIALLQKQGKLPELLEEKKSSYRKGVNEVVSKDKAKKKGKRQEKTSVDFQLLDEFLKQSVSAEIAEWVLDGPLKLFGDQMYRLPDGDLKLDGIKVLRAGLHIGEFKKNRFEPSHALALALGKKDVKIYADFLINQSECYAYFRGESFEIPEDNVSITNAKGWCLLCIDGLSAGWGKISEGKFKNHYPKGLRKDLKEKNNMLDVFESL